MGKLVSMGSCPFCKKGVNTPCFAEYIDGYHCYSCGAHKKLDEETFAFKSSKSLDKQINFPKVSRNTLQFDISVLQWLYKYFVFEDLIHKYKIGYIKENEDSLVFPVIKDNKIVFWQQRYFPSKRFKTGGNKDDLFVIKHPSNRLVLVEDYISAIRVGEHANVLCLWGVHMTREMSKFIQNVDISNIEIWLDPDDAGRTASYAIANILKNSLKKSNRYKAFSNKEPRTLKIRRSKKQPKEYSNSELKQLLEKA